jgi:hypothetical protein
MPLQNRTAGSNPSPSATESGLQRNSAAFPPKLRDEAHEGRQSAGDCNSQRQRNQIQSVTQCQRPEKAGVGGTSPSLATIHRLHGVLPANAAQILNGTDGPFWLVKTPVGIPYRTLIEPSFSSGTTAFAIQAARAGHRLRLIATSRIPPRSVFDAHHHFREGTPNGAARSFDVKDSRQRRSHIIQRHWPDVATSLNAGAHKD